MTGDGTNQKRTSITDLVKEYFQMHPYEDMEHGPVVDYVQAEYQRLYGRTPRDPWRVIRSLHQQGFLIKVRNGIYRYDPEAVTERRLEDFTPEQRAQILERDNYSCLECGRGEKDGVQLHVDHRNPRNLGGSSDICNGQTLCAQHNLMKKQLGQTQAGKRLFLRMYEVAKKEGNEELLAFCHEVLEIYEKHGINGHFPWVR